MNDDYDCKYWNCFNDGDCRYDIWCDYPNQYLTDAESCPEDCKHYKKDEEVETG